MFFQLGMNAQTPILPYTPLKFDSYEPLWSKISVDSSIIDNQKYDGRHHFFPLHNKLIPVSKDGYMYSVDMGGLFGIEGGIINKRNLATGAIVWSTTFDKRSSDFHEFPQGLTLSEIDETLTVICYRTLSIYDPNTLIFIFDQVPVTWSIRKYNINTGELVENNYVDDKKLSFNSSENSNFFFQAKNGFIYLERSDAETDEYYVIHRFDDKLNIISSVDTVDLDFSNDLNDILLGGVLSFGNGYVSFDAKVHGQPLWRYSMIIWDQDFNVVDEIPSEKFETMFVDKPIRISLTYVSNSIIMLRTSKFNGTQFVHTGYVINHKGDLIRKFNYPLQSSYAFYSESNHCPYIIKREVSDGYFMEVYNICDSVSSMLKMQTSPANLSITPINASIIDNKIVLSLVLGKDTIFNNLRRIFTQGTIWMALDGKDLGLSTNSEDVIKTKDVMLYPNPSAGKLQFFEDNFNGKSNIYTLDGQLVQTTSVTDNTLDISTLPAGLYIIALTDTSSGKVYRQKIIKVD